MDVSGGIIKFASMKTWVIIVAGGSGSRFGSSVPKQFLELGGEPVLWHSIRAFHAALKPDVEIIVALPEHQISLWRSMVGNKTGMINHRLVAGGESRFHSVKNALGIISPAADDLIAVHDGVRPLVSETVIRQAVDEARRYGSAVPVVPVTDSIRQVTDCENKALNRATLRAVQTPQVFKAELLIKAYEQAYDPTFTDDASVWERAGNKVHLSAGETRNLKITVPDDLEIAEMYLRDE